jgi:hypothetical protein
LPIQPEFQIDAKHIKNLPEKTPLFGAKFRGGIALEWMETPSGAVDYSNTTFTLAHVPKSNSLLFFINGQLLSPTEDYTISGSTITVNTAPPTGSIIRATYERT